MSKINGIDIVKKVVGAVVQFGCVEICSRGVDKLTDRYTNNVSRVAMRVGGAFLGGYLGGKAADYASESIDKGVKLMRKYSKLPEPEEEENEEAAEV